MTRLFLRGFTIVFLTAMNVGQIAGGHYLGATIGGFLISVVWYGNAGCASRVDTPRAAITYGAGASLGTLAGMFVTRWIYG